MSGGPEGGFEEVPRLGAMLGRYRLDSVIGRGGMGIVFRAVDEGLDRTVAIKVLARDLATDPQVRERFVREARLAAAIEHPHIVPVYEAASAAGVEYIAMRFIPGPDLARVLRREAPLEVARAIAIGGQLADALDAAHARGLIHRDVKPGNVLLEGPGEWAWLTDFGLTKQLGRSVQPTRDGLVGTLEYLAPEAIEHGVVDGRSDQYALACLLYHCLSGATPFEGDSEARVLRGHLHDDPAPIAPRVEHVPDGVDAVLARALAKDPADRFPSCRTFVAELGSVAAEAGIAGLAPPARVATGAVRVTPAVSTGGTERTRALLPARLARRRYLAGALVAAGALAGSAYLAGVPGRGSGELGQVPTDAPHGSVPAVSLASGSPAPWVDLTGRDGVLVFAGDRAGNFDIWAVRPDGTDLRQVTDDPSRERSPSASADGSRIVFAVGRTGQRDIYMVDADGTGRTRLTRSSADDYAPAISPDGRSVAWVSDRSEFNGKRFNHIYLMTDGGDGFDEALAKDITDQPNATGNHANEPKWSPHGRRVLYSSNDLDSADIFSVDPTDDTRRVAVTQDLVGDYQPTIASDGTAVIVRQPGSAGDRFLYRVSAPGREPRLITDAVRDPEDPDFSPDEARLVVAQGNGLLTLDRDGSARDPVAIAMPTATEPDWVASLTMP